MLANKQWICYVVPTRNWNKPETPTIFHEVAEIECCALAMTSICAPVKDAAHNSRDILLLVYHWGQPWVCISPSYLTETLGVYQLADFSKDDVIGKCMGKRIILTAAGRTGLDPTGWPW